MFSKTIEALKAAEDAILEELNALWVPFDPATGGGNVHWHAAGASILSNAQAGVTALREELEKREGLNAAAEAPAPAPEPQPVEERPSMPVEPPPEPPPAPAPEPAPPEEPFTPQITEEVATSA